MSNFSTLIAQRGRRSGFTLLEVVIAAAIGVVVLGLLGAGYISMLRAEKSNTLILGYVSDAMKFERLLYKHASAARQLVAPDGMSVRITSRTGVVSEIRYEDEDENWETLRDNRVVFIGDIANPDDEQMAIRFVSPPNQGADPIFQRDANMPFAPLIVEFVIGDYSRDPDALCHGITGPGFQSHSFRLRTSPRNTP